MGKVKKGKSNRSRQNEEIAHDEEQIPVDSKENAIQTVLDQLQAPSVEEKYCGLQTLALLIEIPQNIEQVIERGVVKVAAPLLMDAASPVRNAAAGFLRNLSTVNSETCDALMEQDAMTPLTCYFNEHTESWTPDINSKTQTEDVDTFIHCTNLLLNLCESSELAIKYLGQTKILDTLPRYLNLTTFGNDIVIAVLQCLFVVVEDNPLAMEKVKTNCEKQLENLISLEGNDPSVLLIKTLTAGVVVNTCGTNLAILPPGVINKIISILANTLSVDHRLACHQVSSNVPLGDGAGKVEPPAGKDGQALENQLKCVSQMLDAQQCSIEIIANMCSCEEGDDSVEGESSDSDEIEEEPCTNGESSLLAEDRLSPQIMEALISLDIFDKVWARTQLPAENVMLILKEYEGSQAVYKKLLALQSAALLCTNNMLSTLPIDNVGSVSGVYKLWVEAGKLVFKQNSGVTLMESATAVMRAALDKIQFRENGNTSGCNLFSDLALSDIEIMLTGIKECQVPEIRSNLIRMVGILALLLVTNMNDTSMNVICTITEFIIEQATKENEVWVLAEAVDTLIDLYSEDETDVIADKLKLVDKMSKLAPLLKGKARTNKRLPKEYKVLVNTAVTNLPRFIKYKKARLSNL